MHHIESQIKYSQNSLHGTSVQLLDFTLSLCIPKTWHITDT